MISGYVSLLNLSVKFIQILDFLDTAKVKLGEAGYGVFVPGNEIPHVRCDFMSVSFDTHDLNLRRILPMTLW